ncbi:phosphodiester glycosidase family protein [Mastigocoleus sp. MO_188.B34]|uniref:phosphodiester glycosidase family protein n=1 Tax=Mastigocoleus sp. MO_188.B34 TaxID=3036635 RepID=UPI00261D0970|nr:phosphodiester glycosidase family protein [Mastigocoleus sp. MO_188.B34]MDJ0692768.1 phosphodiester glycosidase family protein [Mastigocoleus sp. MO_188.B34]
MGKKVNSCLSLSICNIMNSCNYRCFKDSLSLLLLFGLFFFSKQSVVSANSTPELKLSSESNSHSVLNRGGVVASGYQIILNGKKFSGAWLQRQGNKKSTLTYLSDGALRQIFGIDLLSSRKPAIQPVQWFSSFKQPLILSGWLTTGYRYLDITNLATSKGWKIQNKGNNLSIYTQSANIENIIQGKQGNIEQVIVDLDHPTPWQIRQEAPRKRKPLPQLPKLKNPELKNPKLKNPELKNPKLTTPKITNPTPKTQKDKPKLPPLNRDWTITLHGNPNPSLLKRYAPRPVLPSFLQLNSSQENLNPISPSSDDININVPEPLIKQIEVVENQTLIRLSVPFGYEPRVSSVGNPNRLIIDIRPDAMVARDITWAPGLRWRQQFVNLATESFAVKWLEVNPRSFNIQLRPIWSNPSTLVGTAPLIKTAQNYVAAAAINGGFFNRKNRLPLGAIRRNGQWLSSPILNRGAIAWNDSGQFHMGRLSLKETLIAPNQQKLTISTLNSGYVQTGIARYTPVWGLAYIPLTDNEVVLVVRKNRIFSKLQTNKAGEQSIPIPRDGYLITSRGAGNNQLQNLTVGSVLRIASSSFPVEFNRYPHILGAGPLLLQNRRIVLDATLENFSKAFARQKAIRSAICTTASGQLVIAAVHNRVGGKGPTLAEHAQLMQRMGCINALNLDGGSSTSLYLGGQLVDRSPNTAARVHNGIGIFLQPRRENK